MKYMTEAQDNGFLKIVDDTNYNSCAITPEYPGVALMGTSDRGSQAIGIFQIIPVSDEVIASRINSKQGKHTIDFLCTSKEPTPVRFLLCNFSDGRMLFTVNNGLDNITNMVVSPKSMIKLAGSRDDKEVIIGDTTLNMASASDRAKRPINCSKLSVTISLENNDWGYLLFFDDGDEVKVPNIKRCAKPKRGLSW